MTTLGFRLNANILPLMRLLLIKTSSLGDVIHNLPVIHDLKQHVHHATVDWCVEENFAAIPRLHPDVQQIHTVAVRRWRKQLFTCRTWQEIAQLRHTLKTTPYDLIIDTQGLIKSSLITRLTLGPKAGYAADSAREPLAARSYDHHYHVDRALHAVTRNRLLVAAALGYTIEGPPNYGLSEASTVRMPSETPYLVLLTATSRDDKLWPESHWITLGQALHRQGYRVCLPAGSPAERERAARLATAIPDAQAMPPMQLAELRDLLRAASAVVGVDTGLTHLAVAVDTPTVAIYTATDPGLTGVHGAGFHINLGGKAQCPAPEDVLSALAPALPARIPA